MKVKDAGQRVGQLVDKIGDLSVEGRQKLGMAASTSPEDFAHIYRRKTRLELVRISAAVMGIEFCYAAETAFVSPTILKIGVPHSYMSLVWCISPVVGFFLTPILGSLSDGCNSRLGRRRPFILGFSVFIILGLIFVPNGKDFGIALGDTYDSHDVTPPTTTFRPSPLPVLIDDFRQHPTLPSDVSLLSVNSTARGINSVVVKQLTTTLDSTTAATSDETAIDQFAAENSETTVADGDGGYREHPWGIFLTVIGTVMLDFDADACQSPARSYMLDVSLPEDHAVGLSTFTIMAGVGGSIGYIMGGIDWDNTALGRQFGGHVRVVFTIINFIFVICVIVTVFSFREIPLYLLREKNGRDLDASSFEKANKKKESSFKASSDSSEITVSSRNSFNNGGGGGIVGKLTASWRRYARFRNESVEETSLVDDNDDDRDDVGGDDVADAAFTSVMVGEHSPVFHQTNSKNVTRPVNNENDGGDPCRVSGARRFKDYGAITSETSLADGAVVEQRSRSDADTSPSCTGNKCPPTDKWSPVGGAAAAGSLATVDHSGAAIDDGSTVTLKHYLYTIVHMPRSMRILCLTNLFSWSSLVAYTLYFTDFVGEAVFGGDPTAPDGTEARVLYEDGVRFGCWGMALYSMSCAIYSSVIDRLIKRFGAKTIYICGQLSYSVGMIVMSLTHHKAAIIVLSFAPGIMYSTLFTMPYLLVAHYHANNMFDTCGSGDAQSQIRGLGTDVAVVSSMLFLAQFVLSSCMGSIIHLAGTTGVVLVVAAAMSACAAVCSSQISYHGI